VSASRFAVITGTSHGVGNALYQENA